MSSRAFLIRKRVDKFTTLANRKAVYDTAVKAIFFATKSAKTLDLQEQLSGIIYLPDCNSLSHSFALLDLESDSIVSLDKHLSGGEWEAELIDDDEASRAAISMISSVTPQFTKDFLQRTRFFGSSPPHRSNISKVSRFAQFIKRQHTTNSITAVIEEDMYD